MAARKTDHEWVVDVNWDDVDFIVEGDWDDGEPWVKHIRVDQGEVEAEDNSRDMMPLLLERLVEAISDAAVEVVAERERVDREASKFDAAFDAWQDREALRR